MITQYIEHTLTEEENMVINYYREIQLYCGHSKVNGELCLILKGGCGVITLSKLIETYNTPEPKPIKVTWNKETFFQKVMRWFKNEVK